MLLVSDWELATTQGPEAQQQCLEDPLAGARPVGEAGASFDEEEDEGVQQQRPQGLLLEWQDAEEGRQQSWELDSLRWWVGSLRRV